MDWQFTTPEARIKLKRLYPGIGSQGAEKNFFGCSLVARNFCAKLGLCGEKSKQLDSQNGTDGWC